MLKSFLKLAALATVADVVPLTGENRVIVKYGLQGLNRVTNPGLQALLEVAGLGRGIAPTARQVAFQIAPRINAAGRMDDAHEVIRLFLEEDLERARARAAQLHSLNQERQETEAEIVRLVLEECSRNYPLLTTKRPWSSPGRAGIAAWSVSSPADWSTGSAVRCSS